MADNTDPWTQRFQDIDKLMTQKPGTSAATSTPPATTSAGTSSNAPPSGGWGHDFATSLVGGMYNTGSNIVRNLGGTPNPLPQEAQDAMQAYPKTAIAGNVIGGAVAGLPIALAAGEAAPFVAPYIGGLGADILGGAVTGAAQNALTGSPDESLTRRAVTGGVLGAGLGAIGNKAGSWFGAGQSIDPEVAAAASRLRQAGVTDITRANLPDIASNAAAQGAAAGKKAAQQFSAGYGDSFLGQPTKDFSDKTLNAVIPSLGQDVGNAASAGVVKQGANIPWSGMSVNDTLQQIRSDVANLSSKPQIERLLNNVDGKFGGSGVMPGGDLQDLIRNGSPLDLATRSRNADVSDAANRIEQALRDGFVESSPAGVGDAYSLAREKYKLALAAEKNVKTTGRPYLDPATFYTTLKGMYPDAARLGSQGTLTDGAMQYARDGDLLFGGSAAPPTQAGPGLLKTLGVGGAGGAAAQLIPEVMSGNILNPENYLTPTALAAGAVAGGSALARYAGQAYQQSRPFVNALINSGGSPIANPLSRYLPAIGTAVFPQRKGQP